MPTTTAPPAGAPPTKGLEGVVAATSSICFIDGDKGILAYRGQVPIAGALNFIGEDTLYGRYWGTVDEVPFLHFELCYYQAVEWAITNGLKCVQAGAQGEHKVARGYEPVVTKSAHFIPNRSFRNAVAQFLEAEREGVAAEVEWLRRDLPYRSSE